MNYLERNELLLQEVGQQFANGTFQRGRVIGKSELSKFTSIGSYKSSVAGSDTYVGIKESLKGEDLDIRSEMELARIAVIAKYSPLLASCLPLFHGFLAGKDDKTMILTEDFSKGGTLRVEQWPYRWAETPDLSELCVMNRGSTDYLSLITPWLFLKDELIKLDPALKDEVHDLTSMCFIADNRLRLGDFDKMFFGRNIKQILHAFPIDYTFLDFVKYIRQNQLQTSII